MKNLLISLCSAFTALFFSLANAQITPPPYNPAAVNITGGAINNTTIGATTTAAGNFSTAGVGNQGTEGSGIDIGGVTYESSFKVSDIDGTNYAQTILHRHSTTLEPLILGARSNSNTTGHANVTNGQNLFTIYGSGWTTSYYSLFGSMSIGADSSGTISSSSAPGAILFNVTPNASTTPATALKIGNDKTATFYGPLSLTTALSAANGGTGITSPGTSGNCLVSNGTAWTSATCTSSTPSSGSVLQEKIYTDAGSSTSAATLTNITGSSKSITPLSSNSTIIIEVTFQSQVTAGGAGTNTVGGYRLYNNSSATNIGAEYTLGVTSGAGTNVNTISPITISAVVSNSALTTIDFILRARYFTSATTVSGTAQVWKIREIQN